MLRDVTSQATPDKMQDKMNEFTNAVRHPPTMQAIIDRYKK